MSTRQQLSAIVDVPKNAIGYRVWVGYEEIEFMFSDGESKRQQLSESQLEKIADVSEWDMFLGLMEK